DDAAEQRRAPDETQVEDRGPRLRDADPDDGEGTQRSTDEPAEQADRHGLEDELGGDLPAACPERAPQADLPHPLDAAAQGAVGDAQTAHEIGRATRRERAAAA